MKHKKETAEPLVQSRRYTWQYLRSGVWRWPSKYWERGGTAGLKKEASLAVTLKAEITNLQRHTMIQTFTLKVSLLIAWGDVAPMARVQTWMGHPCLAKVEAKPFTPPGTLLRPQPQNLKLLKPPSPMPTMTPLSLWRIWLRQPSKYTQNHFINLYFRLVVSIHSHWPLAMIVNLGSKMLCPQRLCWLFKRPDQHYGSVFWYHEQVMSLVT